MPHCILEYSSNVLAPPDMRGVLLQIHETLRATELFALEDIKSRAIRHETAAVADGAADRSFVTLTVEILDGRTDDVKGAVTDALFETLSQSFAMAMETSRCNLTVQIRDIHRASYRRRTGPGGVLGVLGVTLPSNEPDRPAETMLPLPACGERAGERGTP